jgi:hypothetical protein
MAIMNEKRSSPDSEPDHEGIDFALEQLCKFLDVDPASVNWDAATETVDGDVQAVIGNILRAKFGEDWGPSAPAQTVSDNDPVQAAHKALERHGFEPKDGQSLAAAIDTALSKLIWDLAEAKNAAPQAEREALQKIHDWLVCHPIATADDMAQSFPTMEEIARTALSRPE